MPSERKQPKQVLSVRVDAQLSAELTHIAQTQGLRRADLINAILARAVRRYYKHLETKDG